MLVPFYSRFPDLAVKETRSVKVRGDDDLSDGEYGFIEFYCDEPACDCRRVVVNVVTPHTGSTGWATISCGWETLQFYQDRLGSLILTNGFAKKTRKTPPREIALAEQRKREYLNRSKR